MYISAILVFGFFARIHANVVWVIGANSTIMRCEWYRNIDSIPVMTEQDHKKLAELESTKQGKGATCHDGVPNYLVCDLSGDNTGIVIGHLGYPFLILDSTEFSSRFEGASYVSYPCIEPGTLQDKLNNWARDSSKIFNMVFTTDFEKQVKFSNGVVIALVCMILMAIICGIVWALFVVKRVCGIKTDCFKSGNITYPTRQPPHLQMHRMVPPSSVRSFRDSDEETIYTLPADV